MKTTNQKLNALIRKHDLTSQQVADLVQVSLDAVHSWRGSETTTRSRVMPKGLLELLEIKVGEKK